MILEITNIHKEIINKNKKAKNTDDFIKETLVYLESIVSDEDINKSLIIKYMIEIILLGVDDSIKVDVIMQVLGINDCENKNYKTIEILQDAIAGIKNKAHQTKKISKEIAQTLEDLINEVGEHDASLIFAGMVEIYSTVEDAIEVIEDQRYEYVADIYDMNELSSHIEFQTDEYKSPSTLRKEGWKYANCGIAIKNSIDY